MHPVLSQSLKGSPLLGRIGVAHQGASEEGEGAALDPDYAQYLQAVTLADVQRVARKYFVHPVISTVEPDAKTSSAPAGQ